MALTLSRTSRLEGWQPITVQDGSLPPLIREGTGHAAGFDRCGLASPSCAALTVEREALEAMELNPSITLAEIASHSPALTRELERLGLDYCCGGRRSLAEACRERSLDAAAVVAELARLPIASEAPADWTGLPPADLVDHLEATHHRYLREELPRLSELAAKVSRVHGDRHPELVKTAAVLAEIRADLEPHLRREEEVLFPMIRRLAAATDRPTLTCGSITDPIAVMEQEHTAVGALLEQLRALTGGYQAPSDTCASTRALMAGLAELESDTHLHVHKENNHLFPAVIQLEKSLTV